MEFINEKLTELNEFLKKSKVAIIGLGVSNVPLLDYMHNLKANVTVFDDRQIEKIPKEILDRVTEYSFEFSYGENSLNKLNGFDIGIDDYVTKPYSPKELVLRINNIIFLKKNKYLSFMGII